MLTVCHCLDHRVAPVQQCVAEQPRHGVAQHRAVESAVVRHDLVEGGGAQLGRRRRVGGHVPHLHRAVVDRVGEEHHLGALGIGVNPMCNWHGAERLQIQKQPRHARHLAPMKFCGTVRRPAA